MPNDILRVGCAKKPLTPRRDVYLGGYVDKDGAQNLCRYPQDILGDVYVTAVCLESGGTRVVLVCIDNCLNIEGETTPPGFFLDIAAAAGVPAGHVFLSNTHNHQSFKYIEAPEAQIVLDTVRAAVSDMQSVEVFADTLYSDMGVNRRPKYIVSPHLPYDNRMPVLSFRAAGKEKLLLVNYQMHNTAFGVGCGASVHRIMCGEVMGAAVEQLERERGCTVYFANGFYGAAGPNINGKNGADYPEIVAVGRRFGQYIADRAMCTQAVTVGGLCVKSFTHKLPVNAVYGEDATETLNIRVAAVADIAVLGVDCEPFSEIGSRLRAYSPYPYTILLGNANSFTGYIPTDEAFDAGGEERECRLNKTPYTKGIAEGFFAHCLAALGEAAGKKIQTVFSFPLTGDGAGSYATELPGVRINRLVLDFGYLSRDNCPCDFTLYADEQAYSFTGNSLNFLGVSFDNEMVKSVRLHVDKTYQDVYQINELNIIIHGLLFQA